MSETLKKAAQEVADAWTVTGPDVSGHLAVKNKLRYEWPSLAIAVERLAELLEPDWEYNIETEHLDPYTYEPTGEKEVRGLWTEDLLGLENALPNLRKQAEWEVQGPAIKQFKIVKRRKPEGYVDA